MRGLGVQLRSSSRSDEVGVLTASFTEMMLSLGQMARVAEQISDGDLTVEIKAKSDNDVVGKAFTRMTVSLGEMAKVAAQISGGDLTIEVQPKSDNDVLGKAFAVMIERLRRMTGDMRSRSAFFLPRRNRLWQLRLKSPPARQKPQPQ